MQYDPYKAFLLEGVKYGFQLLPADASIVPTEMEVSDSFSWTDMYKIEGGLNMWNPQTFSIVQAFISLHDYR